MKTDRAFETTEEAMLIGKHLASRQESGIDNIILFDATLSAVLMGVIMADSEEGAAAVAKRIIKGVEIALKQNAEKVKQNSTSH